MLPRKAERSSFQLSSWMVSVQICECLRAHLIIPFRWFISSLFGFRVSVQLEYGSPSLSLSLPFWMLIPSIMYQFRKRQHTNDARHSFYSSRLISHYLAHARNTFSRYLFYSFKHTHTNTYTVCTEYHFAIRFVYIHFILGWLPESPKPNCRC